MKIAVVQTRPVKGDIQANIVNHKKLIDLAVSQGADTIVFPELSLTGYEPALAEKLSTDPQDSRLDDFQDISDAKQVTIAVGLPTKNKEGICISMIIFQPLIERQVYSKKYLHVDEEDFFISGRNAVDVISSQTNIALAICYELSVPEHSENAFIKGADVYLASVAKSVSGVEKAAKNLSAIANKYGMTVLMSNCIGHCDDFDCGGKSAVWNREGVLIGQLNDVDEGILIVNTDTQELIEKYDDEKAEHR